VDPSAALEVAIAAAPIEIRERLARKRSARLATGPKTRLLLLWSIRCRPGHFTEARLMRQEIPAYRAKCLAEVGGCRSRGPLPATGLWGFPRRPAIQISTLGYRRPRLRC
jgi:hypothetical protein